MLKLFKNIGMICFALLLAIGSFFVPVQKNVHETNFASADSSVPTYTFYGSSIYVPLVRPSLYVTSMDYCLIKHSFISEAHVLTLDFSGSYGFMYHSGSSNSNFLGSSLYTSYTSASVNSTSLTFDFSQNLSQQFSLILRNSLQSFTYDIKLIITQDFIADIYSVSFGSEQVIFNGNVAMLSNYIRYNDVNGGYLQICYPLGVSAVSSQAFTDRTYFLDSDITESQIYNQGFQDGLASNQTGVYDDGYQDGYEIGYDRGVIVGTAESNDYSFISLFGAIFDAPITMLTGLLNFNFLGINLWAFVTSLFTLALVLFIVKLVMGR